MKTISSVCAFSIAAVVLTSCATMDTPAKRIAANPNVFQQLSKENQRLVSQGEIAIGMPPVAVELAWGKPSSIYVGQNKNRPWQRWTYSALNAVFTESYSNGPWGWGGYGYPYWGGYGGGWGGSYTTINYIPRTVNTVNFINNRVSSWQQLKPNNN